MTNPLIVLRDVSKVFSSAAGPFTALDDVNLSINQSEFVAVRTQQSMWQRPLTREL